MSEMRRGGGGGGGVAVVDPSNLHLKKELTQIQKASRALRDPQTSSSWRSPLSSARSTAVAAVAAAAASSSTVNHYYHHCRNNNNLNLEEPRGKVTERHPAQLKVESSNRSNNGSSGRRDKKVFLYNWRTHKSESEKSASLTAHSGDRRRSPHQYRGNAAADSVGGDESVDDSLSDARNNGGGGDGDSKSDTYMTDRYASLIFQSKDTNLTPPIRRTSMKKKLKKGSQSVVILKQHLQQLQRQLSLVDQSDDTEEYLNSADLRRATAASPLLSRLKSSKLLRGSSRKEDSSYCYSTPALSTSSFNRYHVRNPSTVGSWDATTVSCNDGDNEVDDQLDVPGRQGCGIPCYWSKRVTSKRRGVCGSCYSPSLSDTLRRKGSSMLCGSQTMYRRRRRGSSLGSNKKRFVSRTAQGLVPLLTSSADGRGGSSLGTDDELSTNFGELDLEALSRLDGRRWSSSCRSQQEGLDLVALNGEREEESLPENITSLSQKYRPMFFEELVGQNIVVQSLMNAIQRGRISPIYLFQGPRGTGKTSAARIFASALNCLASEEAKPCGVCRECTEFISGKSRALTEVDGSNKKGIDRVKYALKSLLVGSQSDFPLYKVIVVDECHLLPSKSWLALLKFLEDPHPRLVFIFITTDLDNVPRTVLSRCQKYLFSKIKDVDIIARLQKIAADENLDVQSDALDLIALNADGSLRDAETMLDQLSLLGKRITTSLVNELVGVVSDEKLLELLELAMSSDTAETVKRARELMDLGVDPMVLMSQLATLIMDIIAGTYQAETRYSDSFIDGGSLAESELERLKHALKLLSEAEKQLRVSSERSTWFTATLLQLGSVPSPDPTHLGSSRRQSSRTTEDDRSSTSRDPFSQKQRPDAHYAPRKSTSPTYFSKAVQRNPTGQDPLEFKDGVSFNSKPTRNKFINGDAVAATEDDLMVGNTVSRSIKSDILNDIWVRCIDRCHSKTLRQLLHYYGKLVSISEAEGVFVAYIAFENRDIKARAERFLSSITNSFEIVLRHNIEVRIILLPDDGTSPKPVVLSNSLVQKKIETTEGANLEKKAIFSHAIDDSSDVDSLQEPLKISKGSFNDSEGKLAKTIKSSAGSPLLLVEGNAKMNDSSKGRKPMIPVQRIESIIHEQRLETAWLQIADKGTPGSLNRLKPERNQVLPQDSVYHPNQPESINSMNLTSQHWEDELNREIDLLKINVGGAIEKNPSGKRIDHYPMSPSLLHDSSYVGKLSKENMGYESGSGAGGCSGLFCWNNTRHHRRGKAKQGTPVRSQKGARFLLFGECAKSKRTENRRRR